MTGINPYKRDLRELACPFCHVRFDEKIVIYEEADLARHQVYQ